MKKASITRKFVVTTEKHEVCIVRNDSGGVVQLFCDHCGHLIDLSNLDSAFGQVTQEIGRTNKMDFVKEKKNEKNK